MANHTALDANDNWLGTATDETVTFSNTNQIDAADVFNGAGGIDTIITSGNINYNFSTLASDGVSGFLNIEGLTINGTTIATFNAAQFGTGKISNALAVTGNNSFVGQITINNATSFSASAWNFTNWVAGSDRININGTSGADVLTGSSSTDSIVGGDGNDTLEGLAGNDTITGGLGIDTVSYANAGSAVTVDLTAGTATGGAGSDTLATIENLVGSGFADDLNGSTDANVISAGAGNDNVRVTDATHINSGDSFDGGADTDTLYLRTRNAGETFNLTGVASFANFEGIRFDLGNNDTLIAQFNASQFGSGLISLSAAITGDTSTGAVETLRIDAASNFSAAGFTFTNWADGIVLINGTTGDDAITGSSQADTITGGAGNDTVIGGAGNDSLDGGTGAADWLSYAGTATAVTASLTAGTATGGAGSDTITGFENLLGGSGNDILTGSTGDNVIDGGLGEDLIDGAAGNDTIIGSAGNDVLAGGAGTADVLDYSGLGVAVTYNAAAGTITKAGGGVDTISGFESIIFGNSGGTITGGTGDEGLSGGSGNDGLNGAGGNDTLSGNDGSDTIDGGTGNDVLNGGAQNDFIAGAAGSDTVDAGAGEDIVYGGLDAANDVVEGGLGNDTLDYRVATLALTVTRDAAGAGSITDGSETDTFTGIESLVLGQASDTFTGGTGNDIVRGYRGADSLSGGDGNDLFLVGSGDGLDSIDGGNGTDTIRAITAGVTVTFAPGLISNVEAFDGAGWANFLLVGTAAGDVLDFSAATLTGVARIDGGASSDTITGSEGADTIYGGTGNDTLNGGGGDDTFLVKADGSNDSIVGGAGNDTILAQSTATIDWTRTSGIEAVNGGGHPNVVILGSNAGDVLDMSAVTLTGIARIDGSAGNDTITGTALADTIAGGSGSDVVDGGDGDDTFLLKADGGTDTVTGGNGSDTILAQSAMGIVWSAVSGVEAVNGGGFANVFIGGTAGNDTLDMTGVTLTGIARIDGGAGADLIYGTAGADTIVGGAGVDTLDGGNGSDTYHFNVSSGADFIVDTGGGGSDTLLAQSAATLVWTNISGIEVVDGNGFANVVLSGTAGADALDFSAMGLTGIARLDAGAGNDDLIGSTYADTIVGGTGADTLTGSGGDDTFRFVLYQSNTATPDHITDFGAGDKIDLSLFDANNAVAGVNPWHSVGSAAFVANDAGALRVYTSGLTTVIEGNINADTIADFRIVLDNGYPIGSGDFLGVL